MSRYIDMDVLRFAVLNHVNKQYCEGNHDKEEAFTHCLYLIDCMPTADVVEVVRCKDCKYYKEFIGNNGSAMMCFSPCCIGGQGKKLEDDFCSYGERRKDEQICEEV